MPKKKKKPRKPWWDDPWRRCAVYHGEEFSYLVHFPRYGTPFIVAFGPRCWGLHDPVAFYEAGFTIGAFPMKKPVQHPTQGSAYAASIEGLIEDYPVLCEFLVSTAYDGDLPGSRQTATLLIFGQDGSWRACLRDRQEQRCLWVSSATFADLLPVIENTLGNDQAVWRDDRVSGAETAKRQNPKKTT